MSLILLCAPLLTALLLVWETVPGIAQLITTPAQTGSRIELNGRPSSGLWGRWSEAIAISDVWLSQVAGVELRDSEVAAEQPVVWFAPPVLARVLFDRPVQNRFLDLDALGSLGWQAQIAGDTLRVNTPPAQVRSVLRSPQSWGERVVVELDRPAPWQTTRNSSGLTVSLDATALEGTLSSLIAPSQGGSPPRQSITQLTAVQTDNRLNLRVQFAQPQLRAAISTLGSPPRLLIDVRPEIVSVQNRLWAPGVQRRRGLVSLGTASFSAAWLVVDLKQPGVSLKPIWSNPQALPGTVSMSELARRWQAAAVINGGFFNRNNQLPLGAIRREGRWVSGPILNRAAVAWNDQGDVQVDRLSLQETLTVAGVGSLPLSHLNSGYVQAGLARYTTAWGPFYRTIIDNEVLITVEGEQVVGQVVGGPAGQMSVPIPANGYVLVSRGFQSAVNLLRPGVSVQGQVSVTPRRFEDYPYVVGAGPLLLKNQQVVLNAGTESFQPGFQTQRADRSALGRLADGKLILATFSSGPTDLRPTLNETAQLMQRLGAVDALNLDGGSSSSLWLGGELVNRSPETAARIHNGIGLFVDLPGPVASPPLRGLRAKAP